LADSALININRKACFTINLLYGRNYHEKRCWVKEFSNMSNCHGGNMLTPYKEVAIFLGFFKGLKWDP
jgi:hypothetical protein